MRWYFDRDLRPRAARARLRLAGRRPDAEPQLLDAHLEEVRSGHDEEPESRTPAPDGGGAAVGRAHRASSAAQYPTAVLAVVGPDGFPFAVRVPVARRPRARRRCASSARPVGAPLEPGPACLTVHAHDPDFTLAAQLPGPRRPRRDRDGWALAPHKLVGGFELPSRVAMLRENAQARSGATARSPRPSWPGERPRR